jgi:acyl-[acyl-carrier-protein] desaturase
VAIRDRVYRIYLDSLETADSKRRWNIFNDIPWDKLNVSKITESTAQCVEPFCSEELYVPDYSSKGLELARSMFGMV